MIGKLITLEGPEGGGKSTVCAEIIKAFSSTDILLVREPGSTPVGEKIRAILKSQDSADQIPDRAELMLFEAARACIIDQVIAPALVAGRNVLCDRFTDSTIAYQGYGRGLPISEINDLNRMATNGLEPDLTILFDLPFEVGIARRGGAGDRIEAAGVEFHRKVRDGFLQMATSYNQNRFRIVDATQPRDAVIAEVCGILQSELGWKKGE